MLLFSIYSEACLKKYLVKVQLLRWSTKDNSQDNFTFKTWISSYSSSATGIKLKRLFYNYSDCAYTFKYQELFDILNHMFLHGLIIFAPYSAIEVKPSRRELSRIFKFQNLLFSFHLSFLFVCFVLVWFFLLSVWYFTLF